MKDDVQKLRKMLQDLRDLRTTGFVDEEQYAENVERLERRLLDAVMNEGAPTEAAAAVPPAAPSSAPASPLGDSPHRPPRGATWQLGLGAVAVAALLLLVGGVAWWAASRTPAASVLKAGDIAGLTAAERRTMTPEQLTESADKLARRLANQPQDADGWAALARLYTAAGRPPEAAAAYDKAVAQRGIVAAQRADFAEARAVANNGNLAGEPTQLLMRALKLDPTHLQALSLAGTAAFDRGDHAMAVAYWEKIVEIAPADDPRAAKARSSLGEARQLARLPAAPASAATALPPATTVAKATPSTLSRPAASPAAAKPIPVPPPAAAASDAISGTITLAPGLASRASPGDTVFVYARAVDGPPFPLAVIRKQVKDLPLRFRLDDSMSMWPSAKVSGFPQVVVTARVSKSGEGQPQTGDLQGQSAPVAAGASGLRIEIEKILASPSR